MPARSRCLLLPDPHELVSGNPGDAGGLSEQLDGEPPGLSLLDRAAELSPGPTRFLVGACHVTGCHPNVGEQLKLVGH